jgi:hypothetical protein
VASLAYGQGAIFATVNNPVSGGVYRLDGHTLALTQIVTTEAARAITTAHGHLWALFNYDQTGYLKAFYITSGRVAATQVALPRGDPQLIATNGAWVWVAPEGGRDDLVAIAPS